MPIYGYQCKACHHTFDALQKISDDPLVDCPECDAPELRKQLSAPKFRLKGSGWYETDFKTGDKRNLHGDGDSKSGSKKDSSAGKDSGTTKSDSASTKRAVSTTGKAESA